MPVVVEPPGPIYLKVEHKWKTANGTQHLHVWTLSLMKATRLLSGRVGNDAAQMNLPLS